MIRIIGAALYQWDTGRSVEVTTEGATHAHFANVGDSKAPIIALVDGKANIPDYLFQTDKQLCVYAVSNGVTIEKKVFPVTKRERPENYVYDEDQRNFIYELINDAQEATEAANQAAQDILAAKERGDFNGEKGEKGDPGKDGTNGVSVTHSWNGTVLTITSASGTSSADLKGEPGEPGSGDDSAVLYTEQTLTPEQQAQARDNIAAASAEDLESLFNSYPELFNPSESDFFIANATGTCNISYENRTLTLTRTTYVHNAAGVPLTGLTPGKKYKIAFTRTGGDSTSGYDEVSVNIGSRPGVAGVSQFVISSGDVGYVEKEFTMPASAASLVFWMRNTIASETFSNITITDADQALGIKNELISGLDEQNMSKEFLESLNIDLGLCDYKGNEICIFDKILCVGDSLTAGGFNHSEGTIAITKYSYPAYLAKLSGVPCENLGYGGQTSAGWYEYYSEQDLSGFDCAIIQLGVNDAIQYEGWTDASITAFTGIINKLKNENTGIKIFVSTIIPSTTYFGDAYDAVSQGIREFVVGLNDENVILLDMAEHGHTADETAYNCGHLSAYGYWRLAKDYMAYISWYINQNKVLFRKVQFIGTEYQYE